jgi:UDP-2,3-diacylglucosamine hydrolase
MHFGLPSHEQSLPREQMFNAWLDSINHDIAELYFLGDIFDFWFEYAG